METGTGKTYVYIKTIMELNKRYGWRKFIVVVPSVAIREGVKKSFDITAEHFQQTLRHQTAVIHLQLVAAPRARAVQLGRRGAGDDHQHPGVQRHRQGQSAHLRRAGRLPVPPPDRRHQREPADRHHRRATEDRGRPKSLEALSRFNALMVLRYSATHKVEHNKVHRLDAVDAYNQKLVKKIAVRGITVKGLAGSTAYLYLDAIEIAKGAKPRARVEIEVQTKGRPDQAAGEASRRRREPA